MNACNDLSLILSKERLIIIKDKKCKLRIIMIYIVTYQCFIIGTDYILNLFSNSVFMVNYVRS